MGEQAGGERQLRVKVVDRLPHDTTAFTQGLLVASDGWLYESTGLWGPSRLRRLDPETGELVTELPIAEEFFGEGIAEVGDHIIWLTFRAGVAHVVDRETLTIVDRFEYEGEGWGLCATDAGLVMSTGDLHHLTVRDPETFEVTGQLSVQRADWFAGPVNDMVDVDGTIWANTFWLGLDELLALDAATGRVTASVDARALLRPAEHRSLNDPVNEILNGITFDAQRGRFLMTGKHWPVLFVAEFVDVEE